MMKVTNASGKGINENNVDILDIALHLCDNFFWTYRDDNDLNNIHQVGKVQMKLLSENCIQGGRVLVVSGDLDSNGPELVDIYYGDIIQGSSTEVARFSDVFSCYVFRVICNGQIIVGGCKSVYMYFYKEDK